MTLDEVKLEIEYILSIDPRSPGANFNHDPDCFERYCQMQERRILESLGHKLYQSDAVRADLAFVMARLD
tara:strand:+ start:1020 stop:1229 length:210 start_codon:yes stop_codon:yes gene_type:complete